MIKNRSFALVYRIAALAIAVTGFLSMMGLFSGGWNFSVLAFYTLQSNVLIILLFIMLVVRTVMGLREGNAGEGYTGEGYTDEGNTGEVRVGKNNIGSVGYFARFEMVCCVNIMLTFLVYWVLLAPRMFIMNDGFPIWTYANLAVHGFTPLLCLLDYILFVKPGHLKYTDVYYVCIFPLVYLIGTSIAGLLGYVYFTSAEDGLPIRFPYFFYDFDRIGMLSFLYIGALVVFLIAVGHAFYLVDKARIKRVGKNTSGVLL